MKNFANIFEGPSNPIKQKEITLENEVNLSPESLEYRHLEKDIKISDIDGISEFSESPDGLFVSYLTNNKSKLKVFDKSTSKIKILYEVSGQAGDYLINPTVKLKTYCFKGLYAIGYEKQGKFVVQELSHGNQSGEIVLEVEQSPLMAQNYLFSKNGRNLICQESASDLKFNDLKTGEIKNTDLGFYSSQLLDSKNGSMGMAFSSGALAVFNKDQKTVSEKMESRDPMLAASLLEDNSFVVSRGESLVFYDVKDDVYLESSELKIGFRSDKIIQAVDKKHLFCHSYNFGGFYVIERETGKVVSKIEGEDLQQNWTGKIAVLNEKGNLEEYHLNGNLGEVKDGGQNIFINGEEVNYNPEKYSFFINKKFETVRGACWDYFENLVSRELTDQEKFVYGEQRLYLEIPLSELENIKEITQYIASHNNIPVQFKFIDQEKSDPEVVTGITRFVLNFKDINDTRKFYSLLSENESYQKIIPDRNRDYYGYQIDNKTSYAFGYTENREDEIRGIEYYKKNFSKTADGNYVSMNPNPESGKFEFLSSGDYEDIISRSPSIKSKEKWFSNY